jgi:two-component system sensor histidine kinase TctE
VPVNAALLREALANLLHNALRYAPAGSHVTVWVDAAGGEAVLAVLDDGPGLAPDELPHASERFRGRHARVGGSGLGLAIVRAVAERHGGRLELASGPGGRGLAARLHLPLATAAPPEARPTAG